MGTTQEEGATGTRGARAALGPNSPSNRSDDARSAPGDEDSPTSGSLHVSPGHFAVAAIVSLSIGTLDVSIAPGPDEPVWLRWARVAAEHPVRIALATVLLLLAVLPGRRTPVDERI